jgi:hypothetical protein
MIYCDGTHMASDTSTEELHTVAARIGLKREWFQEHWTHPHYDVWGTPRRKLAAMGVTLCTSRELVRRCCPEHIS